MGTWATTTVSEWVTPAANMQVGRHNSVSTDKPIVAELASAGVLSCPFHDGSHHGGQLHARPTLATRPLETMASLSSCTSPARPSRLPAPSFIQQWAKCIGPTRSGPWQRRARSCRMPSGLCAWQSLRRCRSQRSRAYEHALGHGQDGHAGARRLRGSVHGSGPDGAGLHLVTSPMSRECSRQSGPFDYLTNVAGSCMPAWATDATVTLGFERSWL